MCGFCNDLVCMCGFCNDWVVCVCVCVFCNLWVGRPSAILYILNKIVTETNKENVYTGSNLYIHTYNKRFIYTYIYTYIYIYMYIYTRAIL